MDPKQKKTISKFMSLVLRHEPQQIGLELDEAGWAPLDDVLTGLQKKWPQVTREDVLEIVATSDKQRFALNDDATQIRANQGHSIEVDLGYQPATPPEKLLAGTATRFLESIRAQGLLKQSRHHVHLTASEETAVKVGMRHGKPAVLVVHAARMHAEGHAFFVTPNQVWLVDAVPPEYLEFPEM